MAFLLLSLKVNVFYGNAFYLFTHVYTYLQASEYISDGLGEDNHTFHRVSNGKSICFYMVAC